MTAAGTIAARPAAGSVPAEMAASLANMLESALAAGPLPGQEARGDAGRGEDHLLAPGPDRGDLPAPVHADAGPRARRVHRPAVRPGRRGRPAGLARRPDRGDRCRPGTVRPPGHPP